PIFDDQPTGSIGDLAVAPSDPNVIYVGSGEGLQRPDLSTGDGIYKSTDGGKTWRNVGLRDAQQIGSVIVDPKDPNRVFVAALGHPYGPNEKRGVFRTIDGGATWERVLYKDENTGAIQVAFDPTNPRIVYADLWAGRQGPWENGAWQGPESGLFKSTDGGDTWKKLTVGLPAFAQGLGRIGFDISRSNPNILYATVDANPQQGGVYRSDDAGESWRKISGDTRLWGRGSDFAEIRAHPKNPEIVFVANTSSYKSIDGGKTWAGFKCARGGEGETITPAAGSNQRSATLWSWVPIRARRSPSTAARRGAVGTTSRRRRCITSSPTTAGRTGSTAGSRRAARPRSPAGAIMA